MEQEVWLSSFLYLACLLVRVTGFLADQVFTNMGQPMHRWMHWKYHFTWSGPCTISLGLGVVFVFSWFACMLVCLLDLFVCLFVCILVFLLDLIFIFLLLLLFFVVFLFSCFFHRLVSHETMYDSWNKLGKVQEALYNYHYLVICHPSSIWRICYFYSMVHQMKMRIVQSSPWWKQNTCALTSVTYSSRLFLG